MAEVAAAAAEMAAGAAEDGAKGDLVDTSGVTGRDLEAMAGVKAGCLGPGIAPAEQTLHSWQCAVHQKE